MAFLNGMSLMPGEWTPQQAQAPQQGWQDKMGGLLSGENALFNVGLGILANNNSRNLSEVLGRGVQQGMQQTQQAKQLGLQNKRFAAQDKRFERQDRQWDAEEQAHRDFDAKFPQHKGLSRISPATAIKLANPELANADAQPYFSDRYIGGKVYSYDHRTGDYIEKNLGGSTLPNKDDPTIRGNVKGAESAAAAAYKPNTDIPGVVSTDLQVAQQANPNLVNPIPSNVPMINGKRTVPAQQMPTNGFNTPYPVTFGAPGTTPTDQAEGVVNDQSIQMRNPARPNVQGNYAPPVGGIAVPTPEVQAALTEQAKANVGMGVEKVKNVKKSDQFLSVANQAKEILNDVKNAPTASGIGAAADTVGNLVGYATDGSVPAAKLESLSGWLVANVPRMEGPQSNFDVQNYQTMAGLIGDRTKPLKVRQGALDTVIKLQEKYKALNQDGNIMATDERMPQVNITKLPAKPSKLTLKKGVIYETPKGNLRWNGTAFED